MFSTGVHQVLDVESHHDARVELTKLIKSVNLLNFEIFYCNIKFFQPAELMKIQF